MKKHVFATLFCLPETCRLLGEVDVPALTVSACVCPMMIRFLDIVVFNPPLQTVYISLSVHGGFSGNSVLKNGL